MHPYVEILGKVLPTYGLMISVGVILANILALFCIKVEQESLNDFFALEATAFLGGFLGAKTLYLLVSFRQIQWHRFFEVQYFNELMLGGFVFYGGLIGGLWCALLSRKVYKVDAVYYIKRYICLIPFIHSFGRVGCFLAGCCYGRPYIGIGAVVFPQESFAPAGVSLFPVQLVEAVLLISLSIGLIVLTKKGSPYTIECYLILYGIIRFVLEYFRDDNARGGFCFFSTSQWISVFVIISTLWYGIAQKKKIKYATP